MVVPVQLVLVPVQLVVVLVQLVVVLVLGVMELQQQRVSRGRCPPEMPATYETSRL